MWKSELQMNFRVKYREIKTTTTSEQLGQPQKRIRSVMIWTA